MKQKVMSLRGYIKFLLFLFMVNPLATEANNKPKPVDLVYPQLDTENSRWIFFSSACRPFGMVNLSPDTNADADWGSGYRYEKDSVKFFSHIHGWQLSGIPVMPVTGKFKGHLGSAQYGSRYSHDNETIRPGYHAVFLDSYGINAELTSTTRVGFHRYWFPAAKERYVLLDFSTVLGPSGTVNGCARKIGDDAIQGYALMGKTSRRPKPVYVFFHIQFDTPFEKMLAWKNGKITGETNEFEGSNGGVYLNFGTGKAKTIQMKVGISYVSEDQALLNMQQELPHWDFDRVVRESSEEWNNWLSRIEIEGGTPEQQRRFYTDLWHALLGRRIISDVNGKYCDMTGPERRIGQIPLDQNGKPLFNHHNSDSFWGAQWTISTLWSLVYPEITSDFVNSMLMMYDDGGLIPRGPSGGNYTAVMTGASSTPFIVGAWMKGIRTFDVEKAYEGMKKNHTSGGMMGKAGYEHYSATGGGIEHYIEKGYVPYPLLPQVGFHQEGAAQTLEYAFQDWCLAQMAKELGKQNDYNYFMARSGNWKNLYDSETGWIRPRDLTGKWKEPFDPYQYRNGFVEANAAQTTWFVPHDLPGLAELMGGRDKMAARLEDCFREAEKLGFTSGNSHSQELHPEFRRIPINYGNQPSIQTAFVFNHIGYPWLTQYWSRKVVEKAFSALSTDRGYNGDEDQGLMGSLSVLMKIGLFEMNSGSEIRPVLELGSPVFDKITIHLDEKYYKGQTFVIEVKSNKPENRYIQSATLNGKKLSVPFMYHDQVSAGGKLLLEMGDTPDKDSAIPESVHPRFLDIPVPSGGIGVRMNPPVLRWPQDKSENVRYEVRLSQDSLFLDSQATITAQTAMSIFNPHRKLENGAWFWQYKPTGQAFSKTLKFTVNDDAVPIVSPSSAKFLKAIPAGHPRVLFGEEDRSLLQTLKGQPDAQAIISEAMAALKAPIPTEQAARSREKVSNPSQQRKFDLDASQGVSSEVYEKILSLAQAFALTGDSRFASKAILFGMEVSSWDTEGITQLSDFGDARCMLGMALVLDTFYDRLNLAQKEKLVRAISARADHFYRTWINDIESKVLSGHVWQHILHYFFQTAIAMYGEVQQAGDWFEYAYELFLARAPVLGGLDGGWVEGVSYFRMNMETMLDIPLFIKKFTGFDFINAHPWYRGNTRWMVYHIPPGSSADGFGDNTEEVHFPGADYIAYAEEMAKLTDDPLAAWYAQECRKYETHDLSKNELLRWVRLTKTRTLSPPAPVLEPELPIGAVFSDIGVAALHSDLLNTSNDLMVAFKSSPLGSYGHMLCDQNTFNILYGGERLFFKTGYKITMDDPHRIGWYRTTKSQNGILINGKGQAYRNDAYGWIARFMQGDEIAYIKGDATQAYKDEATGEPEAKKVVRHMLLLKPDIIVLYDELESNGEVFWDWMIHSHQEMDINPANGIFSISTPAVKGAGKILSSWETQWMLTDTFDVPAVNWRKSRYEDSRLKTYDDPQWHLKVSTRQKSRTAYYLAVIQVSPDAGSDSFRDIGSGNLIEDDAALPNSLSSGANGYARFSIGQWSVSANLDPEGRPDLVIRKLNGDVAFSMDAGEIVLDGEKIKAKQAGSSLLVEKKNGKTIITESEDVYPQMMKNMMLLK